MTHLGLRRIVNGTYRAELVMPNAFVAINSRIVGNPYLGITSGLPVMNEAAGAADAAAWVLSES